MKPVAAAKTDVGRVRQGNEDAYLVEEPLFAVADGMGGHLGGEVASATAVEAITSSSSKQMPRDTSALAELVRGANSAIWDKAQNDPELKGMGTTCTVALIDDGALHIAHVGDSRAYLLRNGELSQLTEDHTLVGRMVREGRLAPEEAERHPQRSIITRALGADAGVEVDEISMPLQEGDRILICSDGLTSMVAEDTIHDVLVEERDRDSATDRLVELALGAGGEDNVTVVVVDVVEGSTSPPAAAPAERTSAPRETTEPEAAPAPPAVDTGVHRLDEPSGRDASGSKTRWGRGLLVTLLVLLLLAAAAYAAGRYTLANAYFVGADGSGQVTIYRGIPEEVGGVALKESEERSGVGLSDLPPFLRADVERGIKATSLEDARAKVRNLEERAEDREFNKRSVGEKSN